MAQEMPNVPQKSDFITHPVGVEGETPAEFPKYTDVDISDWRDVPPAELLRDPSLFPQAFDQMAAARALK